MVTSVLSVPMQEKRGRSAAEEGTAAFQAAMAVYLGHAQATHTAATGLIGSLGTPAKQRLMMGKDLMRS